MPLQRLLGRGQKSIDLVKFLGIGFNENHSCVRRDDHRPLFTRLTEQSADTCCFALKSDNATNHILKVLPKIGFGFGAKTSAAALATALTAA